MFQLIMVLLLFWLMLFFPKNIVAVELDTVQRVEFDDINANHVGIDINSIISEIAASAGYYLYVLGMDLPLCFGNGSYDELD